MDELRATGVTGVVLGSLDHSFEKESWHVPAGQAVEGLTAAQAAWRPGPDHRCIWEVVHHMIYWKEWALRNLRGERVTGNQPEELHWETDADPADEAGWQAAVSCFRELHREFRAYAESLGDQALATPQPGRTEPRAALVYGAALHDSYHAAQILFFRKLQGSWPMHR